MVKEKAFNAKKKIRKSFGRIPEVATMPNLIDVQRASYESFLQRDVNPDSRSSSGLQEVFRSVFPIHDFSGRGRLDFQRYEFEAPKYDVEECLQRGLTYSAPLRVILRLTTWDIDEDTGARTIHDLKEQPVYMGEMPLMTENGTFIVNGTERVIVSQMHRSPGVFFDHDKGKTHSSGKYLYSARVIPYRGSWLDFEFDAKDILHVRIDRKRKLPVTTLLYALEGENSIKARAKKAEEGGDLDMLDIEGMDQDEILREFYSTVSFFRHGKGWARAFDTEFFRGQKLLSPLVEADTGEVVAEAGAKLTARLVKKIAEKTKTVSASVNDLVGRIVARDIVNLKTGLIYAEAGEEITEELLVEIQEAGVKDLPTLAVDATHGPWIRDTMLADKNRTRDEALIDIYRIIRPGEPPTREAAEAMLSGLFFDVERYDLSPVGRVKMNMRLEEDVPDTVRTLRKEDIIHTIKVLCDLKDGRGQVDDIDNLGNRRVRSVGELMENQYRIGLLRMERAIRERMSSSPIDTAMPHDLINAKPAAAAVREFFGSSQLSQFMDQTNPLSEVTHKRRLSALGPGGLTRERAGFEVRDVHPTHYGRICPIETPEGPNIGLINSLATYARVNKYGFIETPYRLVQDGVLQDGFKYLSAIEEEKLTVAQADAAQDPKTGRLTSDLVSVRKSGDFRLVPPDQVTACDVSPKQLVSVAAALIPFLENDDANRALMGSNMQRQAVPLVQSDAPLVGTGMEAAVARDSGAAIVAKRGGVIDQVDGARVVIRATDDEDNIEGVDIYRLRKYMRSNQSTCINQRPLVKVGDRVVAGDIIADGPSTEQGELALGRNVMVAFMPWNGYNYEDSILISERIARDDVFTSIHLEEFEVMARDTKLGQEEITRDIPNAGEEALRNLDEAGIVYVGAEVEPGDILVGKVTPKGESPMTPEEKLLRAIFGEKASDVRDTSLKLPPGTSGTVVDVRVFSRRGVDKDERAMAIERNEIERFAKDRDDERAIQERNFHDRLKARLVGQEVGAATKSKTVKNLKKGDKITLEALREIPRDSWRDIPLADAEIATAIQTICKEYDAAVARIDAHFEDKVDKLQRGDELSPGVMKMVKIFVAVKRKLQPGDKMAGRHGNKGVVSRVVPIEDMPFLENGQAVDIVLNPLGVPSRMNVGQILETHLGWACANIGQNIGEIVDDYQRTGERHQELLDELKEVYGEKVFETEIAEMSNDQLFELVKNIRKGVPIATPVFDGASIPDIEQMLAKAGVDVSGQSQLIDGRTGLKFERKTTVGYIYMLKLHHLVDDKIHSRSIGPYSLITQQPLGGKAQFGGQRFGEMEVWALEAYGAAYTLQEMLTVKSDDVSGRTKVYESIVREDEDFEAGIPESFNVLTKELKSLGLNVELEQGSN
ncbi:DNA-directed RNA polymerase subunit beta [Acetobacteraceae bacterium]|nr:DNA-directed RNA polymerase subunit beta [Acetobacteraceae bacterium]